MKKTIALYYSDDSDDEEYLELKEAQDKYHVKLTDTYQSNHGGQTIFTIEGSLEDMNKFATEVCEVENIEEIEE